MEHHHEELPLIAYAIAVVPGAVALGASLLRAKLSSSTAAEEPTDAES